MTMAYLISRLIYKAILKLFFKFEVRGSENIPKSGPFILVSNHVSYADPAVMGVACHTMPVSFMAKEELFHVPILGAWCRAVGCIPIERHSGSFAPIKKAMNKLSEGGVLGIFPEGERSPDGMLQKAQAGVGIIAAKSKAPIIPLYISGTEKALPIGERTLHPCKVRATIGRAVDITESIGLHDRRKIYESIGEKMMAAISRLKNE